MAFDQVNLGTPPSGQDGDDPRTAFTRINNNFKQLDDIGVSGPIAASRLVSDYNDANQPGDFVATASASNGPDGFGRATVRVSLALDDAVVQHAVDHASGADATRSYNPATDSWSGWNTGGGSAGVVPIEQGGTGAETAEGARQALGIKALATEDVAPISKGGTGAQTAVGARQALGLKALALVDVAPIENGGTGADTAAGARQSLGLGAAATENIMPVAKGGTGRSDGKFAGATGSTAGAMGLVPAPAAGDQLKVLGATGEWVPQAGGRTYAAAVDLTGKGSVVFSGIPASARKINLYLWGVTSSADGVASIRVGNSSGLVSSGYLANVINRASASLSTQTSYTTEFTLCPAGVNFAGGGVITLFKTIGADGQATWVFESNVARIITTNVYDCIGYILGSSVGGDVSQVELRRYTAGQTFTAGFAGLSWE